VSAPPPALTELERGALAAEVGLGGAGPVIGSVGRLAAEKGYDRLIRAFAGMVQGVRVQGHDGNGKGEWPQEAQKAQKGERGNIQRSAFNTQHSTEEKPLTTDFRSSAYDPGVPVSDHRSPVTGHRSPILLLIGDGPEREALERLCGELGVAPRVLFSGFRPDARRLLSLMDLFVLPSRSEGLPVSLLEAMSAGVPVCVTDAGDCRTAVDDGRCGTILPAEEMRWPEVIASLLPVDGEMPAPVLEKAKLARERVAAHYSMEATLDAYERLYADGR
jgi:glycosyltransferase involved in cell wall biosynthesis